MKREEWKLVFSKASENITKEICDGLCNTTPVFPPQEKLIAQEIIHQIFKAL